MGAMPRGGVVTVGSGADSLRLVTGPRISLTIDCADPARLVPFWCEVLGYVPEPPPGGHGSWLAYWRSLGFPEAELAGVDDSTSDSIVDPSGARPRIWFQAVPEPKSAKNRLHIDVDLTQARSLPLAERKAIVDRESQRLALLGARPVRVLDPPGADYYAIVMTDPEGNEFCLA